MIRFDRRRMLSAIAATALAPAALHRPARAQKRDAPGITDTEIKFGQSLPYSGPASAFAVLGRAQAAYFKALNDRGGINGRKLTLISLDDGFSPPKAVEMARKLVEQDEVAFIFGTLGTPLNLAIRPYLNSQKVPQLFIAAGSERFADPARFPWTIGWQPTLRNEAMFYAKHVIATRPNAQIAALYQDDDFGKEMVVGLKEGLGADSGLLIDTQSFQATDPTIDSQIIAMKGKGADTVMLFTYPKQAAQAIRKIAELDWKPEMYLHLGSASIGSTLKPAGLDHSTGIKSAGFIKDATDPQWASDAELAPFFDWMKKYLPEANPADQLNLAGWAYAQTLEHVLRQCGDDLSRENIMHQATNLKDLRIGALLPGSVINTGANDYRVVEQMTMQRFDGTMWRQLK